MMTTPNNANMNSTIRVLESQNFFGLLSDCRRHGMQQQSDFLRRCCSVLSDDSCCAIIGFFKHNYAWCVYPVALCSVSPLPYSLFLRRRVFSSLSSESVERGGGRNVWLFFYFFTVERYFINPCFYFEKKRLSSFLCALTHTKMC